MNRRPRVGRYPGPLVLLVLVGLVLPLGPESRYSSLRAADKKPGDEAFEKLREKFDAEMALEAYERLGTIEKFGTAPSKKTVEFLVELYESDTNSGIRAAVTRALGKIGTEDAVKAIVNVGVPILIADIVITQELRTALAGPFEKSAEEWLLRNGVTAAVRESPEVMEIVLGAIGRLKTPKRLDVLLDEVKKVSSPEVQVSILDALRPHANPKVAAGVASLAGSEKPVAVQVAAYDILGAGAAKKYRGQFIKGLKSPHWEVRVMCLDALAALGEKGVVGIATRLLKDPDPRCQIAAVHALQNRGGAEAIGPLIHALGSAQGRLQDDLADALARLTGKNFGPVKVQWESWWDQNKSSGKPFTAMSAEEFARLKEDDQSGATVLYYGLRVLSTRVAFAMDTSESMNEVHEPPASGKEAGEERVRTIAKPRAPEEKGEAGKGKVKRKGKARRRGPTRLDVAKRELISVLNRLKDGHRLNILRFDSMIVDFAAAALDAADPVPVPDPDPAAAPAPAPARPPARDAAPDSPPTKSLAVLDPAVRTSAEAFINAAKPEGLTNLMGVLKTAFEYPEVDTIYLLSDGAPTIGVTDHTEFLVRLARMNRLRKVKINTISFDPSAEERKLLQALSEQNYGVYVEK
ncbi:MAG TPA: HEAT repeat domain-containing protein [Planctomycetota bacterium]|nr:HEAT repeat domain-containing protein [Planctomycetota bacterium]